MKLSVRTGLLGWLWLSIGCAATIQPLKPAIQASKAEPLSREYHERRYTPPGTVQLLWQDSKPASRPIKKRTELPNKLCWIYAGLGESLWEIPEPELLPWPATAGE